MVSFNATAPLPNGPSSNDGPKLNKARHVTYWKRCLKTYLPPQYASMDANRMMVVYFTFLSLDLLSALDLSEDERENALNWIYLCQHHDGGFRGSPGVDLDGRESEGNREWDVATVPATFFALGSLAILRDDFSRVKRKECLTWLRKVQRSDGSFGEHLGEGGVVEGGMDTRFGMCAAGVRWFLRGDAAGEVEGVPDVEVDKLIGCIRLAQVCFCLLC
jgi:geranylgeranyl transferase type-1 subunit beta